MSVPAYARINQRWQPAKLTVRSRLYRGEPRVVLCVGRDIEINLDNARAIRLANQLVDSYENTGS
ncbi:hypothetical protein [Corynebacterium glyciniphilum]|uniref:hypothetical protein n=1 Tax=Corynebacterium glyciniphilum TaxID=1404244 RepID=UPI00264E1FFC|nr:hypothetical protein [Corynebacterium glyciniphilum]MDN6707406.1 hypothetical protein [Corynebacterium glyciniphilum]